LFWLHNGPFFNAHTPWFLCFSVTYIFLCLPVSIPYLCWSPFSDKSRFTSSRPDLVLVTHTAAKTPIQQTIVGGWVLRSGRQQLRVTGSTQAAPPATSRATNPRQQRPMDLGILPRNIHLVEIKYCDDDQVHQTSKPAERHKKTAQRSLRDRYSARHPLGCGCTIYNTQTLEPLKELCLDSQRVKKLASKLHVHSVNYAARLVHTRRALSSNFINSHHEPVSGQARSPLDPH